MCYESPEFAVSHRCRGDLLLVHLFVFTLSLAQAQTLTPTGPAAGESLLIQASDPIVGFDNATVGGDATNANSSIPGVGVQGNWTTAERPPKSLTLVPFGPAAGTTNDVKWYDGSGLNVGFYITPSAPTLGGAPSVLTGIEFATANDTAGNPNRNPITVSIEGSDATGTALNSGSSWTVIDASVNTGLASIVSSPNSWAPEVQFANTTPYTSYRVIITGLQNGGGGGMQFGQVQLFGTAANVVAWNGSVSAKWNTTDANWQGVSTTYTNGQNVVFDDTGAAQPNVNIASVVNPAGVTFNAVTTPYAFSSSSGGAISGTASVTLSTLEASTVTLSNSNTYTGGTFVNGGTLIVNNDKAIFSSPLSVGTSGTVNFITASPTITALSGVGSVVLGNPNATPNPTTTNLNVNSTSNSTFSGSITEAVPLSSLTKAGPNTLTLTGSSNYSGGTIINKGVLQANSTSVGNGTSTSMMAPLSVLAIHRG